MSRCPLFRSSCRRSTDRLLLRRRIKLHLGSAQSFLFKTPQEKIAVKEVVSSNPTTGYWIDIFTIICCKIWIVFLEIPNINGKEAQYAPFKNKPTALFVKHLNDLHLQKCLLKLFDGHIFDQKIRGDTKNFGRTFCGIFVKVYFVVKNVSFNKMWRQYKMALGLRPIL